MLPIQAKDVINGFTEDELVQWKVGVRKGMEREDWTDLISHPKLLAATISPSSSGNQGSSESPTQQAESLDKMFHQKYRGRAVDDFITALPIYAKIYDPEVHFGRTIPIPRSSGSGKSRLGDELGNSIPTLSICFREGEHPRDGWPPADVPARSFFKRNRQIRYHGEELAAAFLGALIDTVREKLELQRIQSLDGKWNRDWMSTWQLDSPIGVNNSSRYKCFTEVEAKADKLLSANHQALDGFRLKPPSNSREYNNDAVEWHNILVRLFCSGPLKALAQVLLNLQQKYFVLVIDECSQLDTTRTEDKELSGIPRWGMSLIALKRIIKAADVLSLEGFSFWFLLLDTSSSIPDLRSRGPNAPSSRLTPNHVPLPPWPYLGFNQMVNKRHSSDIQRPSDVLSVQHLKAYGRPCWNGLPSHEVLKAAYDKLFFNLDFDPKDQDHVFAAFAIRIGLEISEGEASARLAMDAVRSHMRILIGLSGHLVTTAAPSEPILAVAAAWALNSSTKTYREAIETLLGKIILRGLIIDRGIQGELYSRLLLTLARDKAVLPNGGEFTKRSNSNVHEVQAVQLSRFLQTLLGQNLGIPANEVEQSELCYRLLQDMSTVWINFTHFVQLSVSISEVTPSMLREAWSSGYAFQCAFHQPVIDGLIVAYCGNLNDSFDPTNLFVVPWQTKVTSQVSNLDLARQLTAPFLRNSDLVRFKPRHVAIFMDLGAPSAFKNANGPHCQLSYSPAERPKIGNNNAKGADWDGYAMDNEIEAWRYCLNVRGHSTGTYPVLSGFVKQFDLLFQRSLTCAEMEGAMDRSIF